MSILAEFNTNKRSKSRRLALDLIFAHGNRADGVRVT
jgi:hypothetical protein